MILFFVALFLFYPIDALTINGPGIHYEAKLGNIPLEIKYNHSVELSTIIERYTVTPRGIIIKNMEWQDFGAGLPEDIQGIKGQFYYKNVDENLGKVVQYWFIPRNNATIIVDNTTIRIREGLIKLEIKKCPLLMFYLRRC
ncbi:hypothetical protein TQ32_07035 [Pyrococcus kukulkanii]|uniref:DUF1850 domain-containing protein n=1 Tax=Pyrococcus kukulkanii TaxID=1609559 RepID=A0A127BCE4_9EURY|nr:hypothetical protein TQ32_07035 [Pyrococcus kukulkanii]